MTLKELNNLSEKYKIPAISVDFLNHSYHTVQSKQLDNCRYLICTLTENGVPRAVKPGEIARLRLEKPDKTYVYNECEIIEDGRILVTLTEQILAAKGKAQCDIQLTAKNGVIYSTKNFIINIDSIPYPLDAIESSNEFDALNDIISREGERIKIVEELEETVTQNENVRNENEKNRIRSENTRNENETTRQNQEAVRQNQEAARQANENIRITNENSRKTNEVVRQTNETKRQNNTATAISNAEKATKKANDAADDLQNKLDTHHFVLTEDKDIAGGVPSLDINKKIPAAELYEATTSTKGITQLTDSVTSTSIATAATPNSVKAAYDKALLAENDIKAHNSSYAAHTDIRNLISSLATRLNTLADSDDTTLDQLSEIVAYIKNNKSLIDGITTSKVNVSDIIDNLTSSATNKPLSAKQGKVLNDLITTLTAIVGNKVDKVSGKGLSSNDYTATEKNKLAGIAANANNYVHPTTAGNRHIPSGGSSGQILRWSADGTAAWGSDNNTVYTIATQSANGLLSAADKKKLDGISEGANKITVDSVLSNTSTNPVQNKIVKSSLDAKANSNHTHNYAGSSSAGGSANSAIKLDSSGGSAIQPVYFKDGKPTACTYILETSVPAGAKFTDTIYTLPTASSSLGGVKTTSTVTSNSGYTACPIISGVPYYKDTNTTYSTATQSANGLLSAADKKKLDGITEGANKTVLDSALSSTSTNPVQNKVIKSALDGKAASSHTHSNYFDNATTRTKNTILAAPSTANGVASFRTLTVDDLPAANSTTNRKRVPIVDANGVMEIGNYIDFHKANNASVDFDCRLYTDGTNLVCYKAGGTYININASSFTVASSRRYKENIIDMPESDAYKLLDIDVKRFDYKGNNKKDVAGCIAEDVEKVIPDVCSYKDEEKTIVDGIDYSKFVPYLIKLAQKQQKQIDYLTKLAIK